MSVMATAEYVVGLTAASAEGHRPSFLPSSGNGVLITVAEAPATSVRQQLGSLGNTIFPFAPPVLRENRGFLS